jgi:hypothetical protein
MSDILIARNPDNPQVVGAVSMEATAEEKARQLPKPSGYRILCAIPEIEEKYESGILKAEETMHYEEVLTTVLFVVELGDGCYKDPERFRMAHGARKATLFWFALTRDHA